MPRVRLPLAKDPRPRRKRSSLTGSHLSSTKDSPAAELAKRFQEYLHFPDPGPLYFVMGALAANMMVGHTVWVMLVGPSSCGKTALLMSAADLPNVHIRSSITGQEALLSGVKKKEQSADAKGGLLKDIGVRGGVIFKDFTSVLSMEKIRMGQLLSAFREIFDGQWTRDVGTEGGRSLTWEGRIAVLTGVTNLIDKSHQVSSEMGERFIFWRYPDSEGWSESFRALSNDTEPTESRKELRAMVEVFFAGLGLSWDSADPASPHKIKPRQLDMNEKNKLIAICQIAARCRSSVSRDTYTKEITDIPVTEYPTRLVESLSQLFLGMEYIGVESTEAWRIIGKCALDSMPLTRRVAMLAMESGASTAAELAIAMRVSLNTATRTIEDLEALGVVHKYETGKPCRWHINAWMRERLERF